MILPLMVATVLLFGGLLAYGAAMQLIVRVMVKAHPKRFQRSGILEGHRRHGDRYADHGGCAPHPDRPLGGGLSCVRAGLDLRDGFLPFRPEFHGFRLWRRHAVREVAVAQPPRGHQRPSVLRNVDGRVVRDHEPVDRQAPTAPKPGTRARQPGTRRLGPWRRTPNDRRCCRIRDRSQTNRIRNASAIFSSRSRSRTARNFSRPDPPPPWTQLSPFVTLVAFCSIPPLVSV